MEIWFWYALSAAVFGGVSSFLMKVAAMRKYNAELFVLYGGALSVAIMFFVIIFGVNPLTINWPIATLMFFGGVIASLGGIFRIKALEYIDTMLFFPLLKLLSPLVAIMFGIIFLSESFNSLEWLGLILGLFVPLLLITKIENSRQNNLFLGLALTGAIGIISGTVALINKYSSDMYGDVPVMMIAASLGILVGSILFISYKQGLKKLVFHIKNNSDEKMIGWALVRSIFILTSFGFGLLAFTSGGTLAIVHTIQSLYILIPIILSVVFYKEHWNFKKAVAVILSIVALMFLG